jgi:predicted Zn-dependent peptidase
MRNRALLAAFAVVAAVGLLAAPADAQVKKYQDIKYKKLPEFKITKPTKFTLPNGITVFLVEDHELPLIEVDARIRTGGDWEPAEKTGLASLVGDVQRSGGTKSMTGDQIDDFLAVRAATVETGIGGDAGFASMNCLKEHFDDVFKVFAEILRNPVFAQDKLDVAKAQANTGIARRNDNINQILSREFRRLVYGKDSPLSRIPEYATITAITRDDLVAWHKKYYVPNNVYLGVVGDFDSAQMRKRIESVFGDWPKGEAFTPPPVTVRETPDSGIYFIEKSDVNQANIAMGHLGIEMKNPDYFAVQVMNEVLGGGFASRMFSNVRSKKGLAYNVTGSLGASFLHPGIFRAGLQTKSENTTLAIDAVKTEVVDIINKPPDDAEMKKAKDSILNSFVFNYDSKSKILSQQMQYAFYGLPEDFLEQYRANIEKVTREDVARVAKKYVHPDQLTMLVVGKSADFDKPLTTVGKVTTLDITIPAPADTAPKIEKSAASLAAGREVWSKAAATLGGADGAAVKAIEMSGKMALNMGGQSMSMSRTSLVVFPDKVRSVVTTPMGEQIVVLTGDEGFVTMAGNTRPLPGEALEDQKKQMARDLQMLVRFASDAQLEVAAAGKEDVDGTSCDVLAISYRGSESRVWVAPDGRVLKQTFLGKNPLTRTPGNMEAYYSDYREVGGRMVPHKQVVKSEGQEVMTFTLDSFTVNPPVDEKAFAKPAA